ncbi:MAG: RNA polymerase sigma factor [Myxococcales bacterium]
MDDRELVSACADGDQGAWLELIRRHDRKVLHVLWQSGAREDLEDLRQEVWTRLLARRAAALRVFRGEHPGALRFFLGQVARSVAIDHGRARRPTAELSEESVDPAPSPESILRARRLVGALDRAAAESENPARDRDLLRLHFEEGYTPSEIAEMGLGLSVRGVEAVLRRARERLAELLKDES